MIALYVIVGLIIVLFFLVMMSAIQAGSGKKAAHQTIAERFKASTGAPDSSAATATSLKLMFGEHIGAHLAEAAAKPEETGKRASKRVGAIVGAAVAAIFGGGVIVGFLDKDPDLSTIQPIDIAAGDLHGTLISPSAKAPVVLIVPGSGPTDRDGNSPLGGNADSYKLLAWGLASEGIATVRVDKRGMFGSAAAGDPNAVTVEAYAGDYRAWIDAIREQTGRKCVWLLGHSEGALMVSAAAEGRKDVCGLILVAGMGRKMGDVIRQQLQDNPANAPLLDQAFAAIAEIEAGRHVDTTDMHPALMPLFAPPVQDYLISVFAVDPVEAVRKARVKTLIVQGRNDLQVTVEDARRLNKAPRTGMELIGDMNHVLKDAPFDRAGNLATYADPSLPVSPRLVREIENFIHDDD